jgi:hypothetical protein
MIEAQSKVFVERKKQKAIDMKKQIDLILDNMPSVVSKNF